MNSAFEEIRRISAERPYYYSILVVVTIVELLLVGYVLLSVFEVFPEKERTIGQNGVVLDEGDRLIWLGMEVTPLSKVIRKEFLVPRKTKGIFVLEGGNLGESCGIQTGDVIRSINRRPVCDYQSFIDAANHTEYYGGVFLDIYRDGRDRYVTLPLEYPYGPLAGPYQGQWQLGRPLWRQALPYGPLVGGQ